MKQKKFGARVLTREELRLTLPTYDKLLDQIEEIRGQSWNSEETSNLLNQKINNISILGARGSGKTSILKTLIRDLEKQNEGNISDHINILLPMMIPESMSDDKNLMSMILGLFERVVNEMDEMETKQHKRNQACWDVHESDIKKQYRELIKKFCLIQPEYKKVPIEQYTTENDYVKKHSEAYSAEIQFSSSLNRFINLLSEAPNRNTSNSIKNKLIFIFIDDIDLSTHRCVDVARTLLAYLSHPRIVTVLSGDLQTFEEALTIDFLRKEHALSGDIANIHFLDADSGAFLERKKELSYEYIKKVLPAPYRHHVKVWDLNSRGDYRIKMDPNDRCDDQDAAKNSRSLSELLTDCFIDMQNPPIFQCLEIDDYFQGENLNSESEDDSFDKIKYKNIPQLFHIFDSTARGLNNVYNVLLEIRDISYKRKELKNQDQQEFWDGKLFQQIKLLLETIVVSNSKLNRYYSELFADIIKFGTGFEDTDIDLDNLNHIIEREKGDEFLLFTFVDFSIRLLRQTNLFSNLVYMELRLEMMKNLINHPRLSGSTYQPKEPIFKDDAWCWNQVHKKIEKGYGLIDSLNDAICSFLFNLDFYYAVMLYDYLTDGGYNILSVKGFKEDNQRILSLYYLILSVSKITSKDETEISRHLVSVNDNPYSYIKYLSGVNRKSVFINTLFRYDIEGELIDDDDESGYGGIYNEGETHFTEETDVLRRLLINAVSDEWMNDIFPKGRLKSLKSKEKEYMKLAEEDHYQRQLKIIFAIDRKGLWKSSFSDKVIDFIFKRKNEAFHHIESFGLDCPVDISNIEDTYIMFKNAYKNGSISEYREEESTAEWIINSLNDIIISKDNLKTIPCEQFMEVKDELEKTVGWCRRVEVHQLLKSLEEARLIFNFVGNIKNAKEKLFMWFHLYACARSGRGDSDFEDIYFSGIRIEKLLSLVYEAMESSLTSTKTYEEYIDTLKKDVPDKILSNFKELFSEKETIYDELFGDLFSEKEDIDEEDVEVSNAES